jgi:heat shock protein HtpX
MNARTGLLMIALTGLLILMGYLFGGLLKYSGLIYIFFAISVATNIVGYWYSDKVVLAMYRARQVTAQEMPQLHEIVERLAMRAGVPKPKVYVIPTDAPNAFATGRDPSHAAVAVTQGIMRLLTPTQIEGVLAHEMAHVKNHDTLISTMAAIIAGMIMVMARFGFFFGGGRGSDDNGGAGAILLMILAPFAAMMIQLAISRSREYRADETGARYAGNPMPLAEALQQLERSARARPMPATASTAHLFIVNPLRGGGMGRLFSTHPPTEDRVKRLMALAHRTGQSY